LKAIAGAYDYPAQLRVVQECADAIRALADEVKP